MRLGGRHLLAVALAAVALVAATPAGAASLDPYDGKRPFRCKIQAVGTGVDFPDPAADPFCVRYNKRNQNLAEFGVIDFLANEPARVAAALGKCFYFQRDRWRGSVDTEGEIETYNWKGAYFFDLAAGGGGAFVKRVRLLGNGGDPGYVEQVPEPFRDFLHPTGGGGMISFQIPADPRCAAQVDTPAEQAAVYRPWYLPTATG